MSAGSFCARLPLRPPSSVPRGGLSPLDAGEKLAGVRKGVVTSDQKLTSYEDITRYNNFYEFGTDKSDPAKIASYFKTRPWTITIEGEVKKPAVYQLEDFVKPHALEERIYRLRCVEAWSMVIPWVGFPLAQVIKRVEPTSRARYVEFTTVYAPQMMPGQRPGIRGAGIDWPYVEGLRMDEAVHPPRSAWLPGLGARTPDQQGRSECVKMIPNESASSR